MFAYCLNNPVNMMDESGNTARPSRQAAGGFANRVRDIGIKVVDEILEEFADDVMNYNINNESEEVVLQSEYFSIYNGVPVLRFPECELSSFNIVGIIFLEKGADVNTLKHEHGHSLQEKEMGTGLYVVAVAVPSVTYNLASKDNDILNKLYYSMPCEYDADMRGRVHGRKNPYAEWAPELSKAYFSYWGM